VNTKPKLILIFKEIRAGKWSHLFSLFEQVVGSYEHSKNSVNFLNEYLFLNEGFSVRSVLTMYTPFVTFWPVKFPSRTLVASHSHSLEDGQTKHGKYSSLAPLTQSADHSEISTRVVTGQKFNRRPVSRSICCNLILNSRRFIIIDLFHSIERRKCRNESVISVKAVQGCCNIQVTQTANRSYSSWYIYFITLHYIWQLQLYSYLSLKIALLANIRHCHCSRGPR
jgi:hypothetical protein